MGSPTGEFFDESILPRGLYRSSVVASPDKTHCFVWRDAVDDCDAGHCRADPPPTTAAGDADTQ